MLSTTERTIRRQQAERLKALWVRLMPDLEPPSHYWFVAFVDDSNESGIAEQAIEQLAKRLQHEAPAIGVPANWVRHKIQHLTAEWYKKHDSEPTPDCFGLLSAEFLDKVNENDSGE
jgi:hypothetical protein